MYKLALNVMLSGYSSEQWLPKNKIYMPESGGINRNGNVSPQNDLLQVSINSSLALVQ